jgi:DNA-binding IclR family transcriptional regulator
MRRILAFLAEANEPVYTTQIVAMLGKHRGLVRKWLLALVQTGYVDALKPPGPLTVPPAQIGYSLTATGTRIAAQQGVETDA